LSKRKKAIALSHDQLVARAVRWLLSSGRCGVAVPELVTSTSERPDAMGWRGQGMICVLVECKATRSDFLADRKKPFRRDPGEGVGNKRYFMTPPGLINPFELPENWGLLEVRGKIVKVVRDSGDFEISLSNSKSERFMYALLRRVMYRKLMKHCLSKKWGGKRAHTQEA
jgi:hypothetical protein